MMISLSLQHVLQQDYFLINHHCLKMSLRHTNLNLFCIFNGKIRSFCCSNSCDQEKKHDDLALTAVLYQTISLFRGQVWTAFLTFSIHICRFSSSYLILFATHCNTTYLLTKIGIREALSDTSKNIYNPKNVVPFFGLLSHPTQKFFTIVRRQFCRLSLNFFSAYRNRREKLEQW
jgi:hypothetical protein